MKRTKEEKKAFYDRLRGLSKSIKSMSDEARTKLATRLGTITAEGHSLSIWNTCCLWMQANRELVQVGGFRQWMKVGRVVRKGESAIGYIMVPLKRKSNVEEVSEQNDNEKNLRFKWVAVFDVTQTEEIMSAVA